MHRHLASATRRALVLVLTAGLLALVGSATVGGPTASAQLAAAAPATPILLSAENNASKPGVAVASDGTSHIAWAEEDDEVDRAIVYCRLPRGATACDVKLEFTPTDLFGFGPIDVLVRDDDHIQLLANYCCSSLDASLYLIESFDGGASFQPARQIGTFDTGGSIAGPGDNAITAIHTGSDFGAAVQVAETDAGVTRDYASLNDGPERWYSGGVALIDSATPISAYTDLADTFVRQYDPTAGTGYNDAANWLPSQQIVGENEPTIVSGAAGTYLMTHYEKDGNALQDVYQVRRISPDDGTLGQPFQASDIGDSIFGTLTADDGGGLTAVWTGAGDTAPIRSSYAATGEGFTPPGILVKGVRAYHLRVSTAADGGGLVVWDDNGNRGEVYAAPIPAGGVLPEPVTNIGGFTPPDNTSTCTRSVTIKPGVVAATRSGCWEKDGSHGWVTKKDVNVNGIDFVTGNASTTVKVDTQAHKITAGAGVVQKAGPIVLAKDPGTWDVDGATTFDNLEKANIKLFDFKVLGQASVRFEDNQAKVTINLALPSPFDVISGQSVLTTTQKKGLILTGITIKADELSIGDFGFRNLLVKYDAGLSTFDGSVQMKLPPSGAFVETRIGFKQGKLVKLALTYQDGAPFPFTIYPGLWVNGVGFSYDGTDGFAIGGGADFAIPSPTGPLTIDAIGSPPGTGGGFRFAIPSSGPTALDLAGTIGIFGFDLAQSHAHFDTSGLFTFDSQVDIGVPRLGVQASVLGKVNLQAGTFVGKAEGTICVLLCANAKGVISDIGVAVCGEIEFGVDPFSFELAFLVGYKWQSGIDVGTTCDTGSYETPTAGSQPVSGEVVLTPDGKLIIPNVGDPRSYSVNIPGEGGVPLVTVRDGSNNVIVQSDPSKPLEPQSEQNVVLIPSPATDSVRLVVVQDGEGALFDEYRISSQPGSKTLLRATGPTSGGRRAPLAITVAGSYDPTVVTGKLAGTGRSRTLSYDATNLADSGRTVRFVETSAAGVSHVIGEKSAESGKIPFTVFDGPAGKRTIEAVVLNDRGMAVSTSTVATFDAPGFVLPAKATALRLKVKGDKLSVTWEGKRSKAWLVFVSVADGRRLQLTTTRNAVTVPGVSPKEKASVKVVGVDGKGRTGPVASGKR